MGHGDWTTPFARSLGFVLGGESCAVDNLTGREEMDDTFLVLLNAYHEAVPYVLPPPNLGRSWELVLDTNDPAGRQSGTQWAAGITYPLGSRSMAVLRRSGGVRGVQREESEGGSVE
jgi:glycogen operon protein